MVAKNKIKLQLFRFLSVCLCACVKMESKERKSSQVKSRPLQTKNKKPPRINLSLPPASCNKSIPNTQMDIIRRKKTPALGSSSMCDICDMHRFVVFLAAVVFRFPTSTVRRPPFRVCLPCLALAPLPTTNSRKRVRHAQHLISLGRGG